MTEFSFVGTVPASKSLMLRALILSSYKPIEIYGDSECDDVVLMKKALTDFYQDKEVSCGLSGAAFRFMALRLSRQTGSHVLTGEPRLLSRPHEELKKIFAQLSVGSRLEDGKWIIDSKGWFPMGDSLHISGEKSSQFASAALLNCWGLKQPMHLSLSQKLVSEGYWKMTLDFVQKAGMEIETWGSDYRVKANQQIVVDSIAIEPDLSSAFSVAALAAVSGNAHLSAYPSKSLQPDRAFPVILSQMGVRVKYKPKEVSFQKPAQLLPVEADLCSEPDLFPVLAALCGLARGKSRLTGAEQLKYKESNRIELMADLLTRLGTRVEILPDGLEIVGPCFFDQIEQFEVDPDQDHRIAMAAAVLKKAGAPLKILHPEVVDKSFPEFWRVAGVTP